MRSACNHYKILVLTNSIKKMSWYYILNLRLYIEEYIGNVFLHRTKFLWTTGVMARSYVLLCNNLYGMRYFQLDPRKYISVKFTWNTSVFHIGNAIENVASSIASSILFMLLCFDTDYEDTCMHSANHITAFNASRRLITNGSRSVCLSEILTKF